MKPVEFHTDDGYVFILKPGGKVEDADGDMAWPSIESFFKSMAEEGMPFAIIGKSYTLNVTVEEK